MTHDSIIYIGYLTGYHFNDPVILCVSDEKSKVKYYLEKIRNLKEKDYCIYKTALLGDNLYDLYSDYILEEYSEKYKYLTNRDIEYINNELYETIFGLENDYNGLVRYRDRIKNIPKVNRIVEQLDQSIYLIEEQLSKVKTSKRIGRYIIENSIIGTPDILEYLQCMKYEQESKECRNMFLRKIDED